jgi:NAD(P)-dependent dehydrogenase (short-subunit alcohol dehydrogenase family)
VPQRRPTALVTGASRGIGKAIAVALATSGYDVAITARTVREGDGRSHDTTGVLPGSLEATAAAVRAAGVTCIPLPLDLLDLEKLNPTVDKAVAQLGGRLDVCVNNAIYVGPGNDSLFADAEPTEIVRRVTGNLTAQLLLTQLVLRRMLQQPLVADVRGSFVNITSAAGQYTPKAPIGRGGFALTYAATKAGFHRIADMIALEYGDQGIRAYNVNPGFIATERVLAAESLRFVADQGAPPELVGRAVVNLLADYAAANGGYFQAQQLAES